MELRSTQCTHCGKLTQIPTDVEVARCMYCGKEISVRQVIQISSGPRLENLLGMARTALIAGNAEEALSYFNRVLEIDPQCSEAWIGKGKAAGWQSSLVNMRFGEMTTAFGHAIATEHEGEKQKTLDACVLELNKLVVTLYGMARKHMLEFVALEQTWVKYIAQVGELVNALTTAHSWNPRDKQTLENIVHLCKDNIEGVKYRDPFQNNASKAWFLAPQYEALMRSRLSDAAIKLQAIDPAYIAPQAQATKPDACFVVTATMGDASHPVVSTYRLFRDEWLIERSWGRAFITSYYRFGPKLAKRIEGSDLLRSLSYCTIIRPVGFLIEYVLKKKLDRR